ncbi:MAG: aspartate kinase [Verrucomicrobiota bacterium]
MDSRDSLKVCKFGGSSLSSAERVGRVCDIIANDAGRRVVVVSAPGKRFKDDIKVTDLLIDCAERRLAGEDASEQVDAIVRRYAEIETGLGIDESIAGQIASDLHQRLNRETGSSGRFIDMMKAAGEDNNARLVAAALREKGIKASYVNPGDAGLLLTSEYGNAQVLPESFSNLKKLGHMEDVVVFPGFFGYTREGQVATFPRGGSDITGAILAATLRAELYENFTDVDSVFPVDPSVVSGTEPIPELTYREMRELSYAGFGVLHDEAIVPVVEAGIDICIKGVDNPAAPGTFVRPARDHVPGHVIGIAGSKGFCTIFLEKYLMNRELGIGRKVCQVLEEENLSYEHMPSGIDSLSIIVKEADFEAGKEERVLRRLSEATGVKGISVERNLALIMMVGEGMRYSIGLASRATAAIAQAGVSIEMINQGSSEISIMFGVKSQDKDKVLLHLYKTFFERNEPEAGI